MDPRMLLTVFLAVLLARNWRQDPTRVLLVRRPRTGRDWLDIPPRPSLWPVRPGLASLGAALGPDRRATPARHGAGIGFVLVGVWTFVGAWRG